MSIAAVAPLAFYAQEGDLYIPSGLGSSPWTERTQSGVSVVGLLAHLLERNPAPVPMLTVRLTTDLFGAVPMEPLHGSVRTIRDGRRVQLLEAELRSKDRVWARATALRMRTKPTPAMAETMPSPYPSKLERAAGRSADSWCDMIAVHGTVGEPGPAALWIKLNGEVVAGHALTALQRLAMASDFGNGVGGPLPFREWTLANLDISLHLSRLPEGEWIYIESDSKTAGNGVGIAHSLLGDRSGILAHGSQSIFIEQRTPRAER